MKSLVGQVKMLSRGLCRGGRLVASAFLLGILAGCGSPPVDEEAGRQCDFLLITNFDAFQQVPSLSADRTVFLSPEFEAGIEWDELVVSWNVVTPPGTGLKVEARAESSHKMTGFYILGLWSLDAGLCPRQSVNGQEDSDGTVETDTLIVRRPARAAQLRLTLFHPGEAERPRLRLIALSFLHGQTRVPSRPPNRGVWGVSLPVPGRSQLGHAGADGWCSPTSVSMVLAYWAGALRRPELDLSVPEVAREVQDPGWGGTGNWCFNTAFAGQLPGMRAYVVRLADMRALEQWLASGIPVVASVSSEVLEGHASNRGNGHLVVCSGFTKQGDVIAQDPWTRLDKGESVRRVYRRNLFLRAWARSKFTVYLIYPQDHPTPG